MAIKKNQSVYGVIELNKVAAVKTGEVFVQYALDATQFATAGAENGMLLVADHVAGTVKLPATANDFVMLHASVEKDYEEKGRKYFIVKRGEFLPRLYKLHRGDIIETNAFQYDDAVYATYDALVAAISGTAVFGVPSTSGLIDIKAATTAAAVVELKAVKGVTLPNGEKGIKFVVAKA